MNRKGFTMIELIATLLILGIVIGITIVSTGNIFDGTKKKTEDVFVGTIKDALDMYLNSKEVKKMNFSTRCSNTLDKSYGRKNVYKRAVKFSDVLSSEYKPMDLDEFKNPANDTLCDVNANVTIYRDEDYVYYYSFEKEDLDCLTNISDENNLVTNLPGDFTC